MKRLFIFSLISMISALICTAVVFSAIQSENGNLYCLGVGLIGYISLFSAYKYCKRENFDRDDSRMLKANILAGLFLGILIIICCIYRHLYLMALYPVALFVIGSTLVYFIKRSACQR